MPGAGRVLLLLILLSVLVLGRTGLALYGDPSTDSTDALAGSGMITSAVAASNEVPITSGPASADDIPGIQAIPEASALPYTPEDVAISQAERETLLALRKQREAVDAREKALDERSRALEQGEKRLDERIADLEELESRIKDMLEQEKSINTKKIKRLTAVYEGMKAAKAAPVLAQMDLQTVVRMFSRMDEKQVGKILSFLPPEKAVEISQALTDRISELQ